MTTQRRMIAGEGWTTGTAHHPDKPTRVVPIFFRPAPRGAGKWIYCPSCARLMRWTSPQSTECDHCPATVTHLAA